MVTPAGASEEMGVSPWDGYVILVSICVSAAVFMGILLWCAKLVGSNLCRLAGGLFERKPCVEDLKQKFSSLGEKDQNDLLQYIELVTKTNKSKAEIGTLKEKNSSKNKVLY